MTLDPLTDLHNMPKEPQLGEIQEKQKDNESYKNETFDLEKAKVNFNKNIYGVNSEKKSDNDNQKQENNTQEKGDEISKQPEVDEQFKDSPHYVTLTRLKKYVSEEAYNKALEEFQKAKTKEDSKIIVKNLADSIPDMKAKSEYTKLLDGEKEKVDENSFKNTEFAKDSKELKIDLDKGVGGLEIMLAENYVSVPSEKSEDKTENTGKEDDIRATMDTSMNIMLEENTPEFKQNNAKLITQIREEVNLEEKYKLLKNLYKENLKEDAKLKGKKVKEEYNIKQSSLQSEAEELSRQYKEAQKITDEVKRAKEIAKIQAEAKKVLTEGKEQEEFIAQVQQLSGGKMDVTSNGPEKEKQK